MQGATILGILIIIAVSTVIVYQTVIQLKSYYENKKLKRCSSWKVGDKLTLSSIKYRNELKRVKQEYAILSGWSKTDIYIEIGDVVYKVDWDVIDLNKSAYWRTNYEECQSYMGTNPSFSKTVVDDDSHDLSEKIDGTPIDCLSETLCQVHLNKALETENFELAALLRKRMESFR
jgi:hypothetical protein